MHYYYEHSGACAEDWRELAVGQHFDLRAMFAEFAVRMALQAQARDLFLDLQITPETPRHFHGEPEVLREIITTLTCHCLDTVERGGVSILIRSSPINEYGRHALKIVVTDTGKGIPPTAVETGRFEGQSIGLARTAGARDGGLARVERLVRQLAGAMIVTPISGWGTRYAISVELMAAKLAGFKNK